MAPIRTAFLALLFSTTILAQGTNDTQTQDNNSTQPGGQMQGGDLAHHFRPPHHHKHINQTLTGSFAAAAATPPPGVPQKEWVRFEQYEQRKAHWSTVTHTKTPKHHHKQHNHTMTGSALEKQFTPPPGVDAVEWSKFKLWEVKHEGVARFLKHHDKEGGGEGTHNSSTTITATTGVPGPSST